MSSAPLLAEAPPAAPSLAKPQTHRRPLRKGLIIGTLLLFLFSILGSAAVLIFSPATLEAMSAIVLPPQPGMIAWNGHDRITVVAMGLTQRTNEPARTDTLLVMDINPSNHHVNMLSVPRDLWVDIPGYGYGKLAIAYELGGPKLAAYTLERDLQIPVDYTMAMTFRGFIKLIDAMGGVDVNVPRELNDPTYPCLTGYAYCPIDIKSAEHTMNAT